MVREEAQPRSRAPRDRLRNLLEVPGRRRGRGSAVARRGGRGRRGRAAMTGQQAVVCLAVVCCDVMPQRGSGDLRKGHAGRLISYLLQLRGNLHHLKKFKKEKAQHQESGATKSSSAGGRGEGIGVRVARPCWGGPSARGRAGRLRQAPGPHGPGRPALQPSGQSQALGL